MKPQRCSERIFGTFGQVRQCRRTATVGDVCVQHSPQEKARRLARRTGAPMPDPMTPDPKHAEPLTSLTMSAEQEAEDRYLSELAGSNSDGAVLVDRLQRWIAEADATRAKLAEAQQRYDIETTNHQETWVALSGAHEDLRAQLTAAQATVKAQREALEALTAPLARAVEDWSDGPPTMKTTADWANRHLPAIALVIRDARAALAARPSDANEGGA